MKYLNIFKKISIILLILFSIPAIFYLFQPGYFQSDDGNWMVIRFSAFYESLRNGQFPVRFLSRLNNGYGYPVSNFLYPLFMYIGVPIHILGASFVDTIKVILGTSLIFSAVFCFLWLRKRFDYFASFVGSLLYLYFPYHLWDVYKRGSVGEVLALAIVPFILWSIEKQNLILAGIGYGLLITSHNSLALLFLPIIFLYHILSSPKINKKVFLKILSPLILGLGLGAFFWIPAIYDKQFTIFDSVSVSNYSDYFVSLSNYNLLGFIFILVLVLSLTPFYKRRNKVDIYFLSITVVSLFLIIPFSEFLWRNLPFVALIQFPFRFLSLITLSIAFLSASQLSHFKNKAKIIIGIIYLLAIFFSAKDFLKPQNFENYPDSYYSTNQDTTTVKNEYMPRWIRQVPAKMPEKKIEIISGEGEISNFSTNGNKFIFNFFSNKESQIQINTVYFPGWMLEINRRSVPIIYDENGLIRFNVSSGNHHVEVKFSETRIRFLSDVISIISLLFIIFLLISKKKYLIKL
ncbi:MAG: hypothetical protein HYT08_01615 [Candidatus Levybacteria bacterium]|nr:hypothetical protein [Candidatus Levybacteria bacterium]